LLPLLVREALAWSTTFTKEVAKLAREGVIDVHVLKGVKHPARYGGAGEHLIELCHFIRANWGLVSDATSIVDADLDRAEMVAEQIFVAVKAREQGPGVTATMADLRLRTYALFFRIYEEARQAVARMPFDSHEKRSIAPDLFEVDEQAWSAEDSQIIERD
jgi:hypothetical protein